MYPSAPGNVDILSILHILAAECKHVARGSTVNGNTTEIVGMCLGAISDIAEHAINAKGSDHVEIAWELPVDEMLRQMQEDVDGLNDYQPRSSGGPDLSDSNGHPGMSEKTSVETPEKTPVNDADRGPNNDEPVMQPRDEESKVTLHDMDSQGGHGADVADHEIKPNGAVAEGFKKNTVKRLEYYYKNTPKSARTEGEFELNVKLNNKPKQRGFLARRNDFNELIKIAKISARTASYAEEGVIRIVVTDARDLKKKTVVWKGYATEGQLFADDKL